jgi:hypothetical protein
MEVGGLARLSIVGLGYGAGEQVTLHGYLVLAASRWTGYFGLTRPLARFLFNFSALPSDMDEALASQRDPAGFTERAARMAVHAAITFRRAAVAVSGHPAFGNPFTMIASALARAAGIHCETVAAPSGIDHYGQTFMGDLIRPGTLMLDARDLLAGQYTLDRRFSLALWNAGYLAAKSRLQLAALLWEVWGPDWDVVLFRAGGETGDRKLRIPMYRAVEWSALLDSETLLIVPARTTITPL